MTVGTIQLDPRERRHLGIYLSFLCIVQFVVGLVILSYGIYFHRNILWKISLISTYDSGTFTLLLSILGATVSFVHICGTKMFYDSGKEATRHRFESFLFLVVVLLTAFFILEFAAGITCKIHYAWFDKIFANEGEFLEIMRAYGNDSHIQSRLDQLQIEDECCGADSLKDWMTLDWVPSKFNPLLNPAISSQEKSIYYPWPTSLDYNMDEPGAEQTFAQPASYPYPPVPVAPIPALVPVNPQQQQEQGYYEPGYRDPEPSNNYGTQDEPTEEPVPANIAALDGYTRRPRRRVRRSDLDPSNFSYLIDLELGEITPSTDPSATDTVGGQRGAEKESHLSVVPWSCCSIQNQGPCIHDYVTQQRTVTELRSKAGWNGDSLNQRGCWKVLKKDYIKFMFSYMVLLWVSFVIQIFILLPARYLQTSVENVEVYNREDKSAPGYLWNSDSDLKSSGRNHKKRGLNLESPNNDPDEEVSLLEEYEKLKKRKRKRQRLKQLLKFHKKSRRDGDDDDEYSRGGIREEDVENEDSSDFHINDDDEDWRRVPAAERTTTNNKKRSPRKIINSKLNDKRTKSKKLLSHAFTP